MKVLTNNLYYSQIADVIREQNGTNNTYKPPQIVTALKRIFYEEVEGVPPIMFQGIGENLLDYRIDGASGGVGDEITDSEDINYGKYKISIIIKGKNWYNQEMYPLTANRIVYGSNGTTANNGSYSATLDFIPCEDIAGKTIILNKCPGGASPGIAYYKDDYSFITGTRNNNQETNTPIMSEVPSNAKYLRFTVPANETEIQIEIGETFTGYEPYFDPIIVNLYLDEPIEENESIALSDTNISISTIMGTNILTVGTTVQPSNVYVKARKESSHERIMRERYEEAQAQLDALNQGSEEE